jgi:uncharacterized Zn finger protein
MRGPIAPECPSCGCLSSNCIGLKDDLSAWMFRCYDCGMYHYKPRKEVIRVSVAAQEGTPQPGGEGVAAATTGSQEGA